MFSTRRDAVRDLVLFLGTFCCLMMVGCGGAGKGPKTVAAKGVVLYNNSPVEGATVVFLSDGSSPSAKATTEANGEFVLTTSTYGDGAVVGNYQVIVSKDISKPGAVNKGPMSMEDALKASKENQEAAGPSQLSLLPKKYGAAATSGINLQVAEDASKNVFKIELVD